MSNGMNTIVQETKSRFLSLSLPSSRQMGKVHSVFKTSFNVVVNDQLFNFSQRGMSLSAHGCIVDGETMNWLLEACSPGDIVKIYEGKFSFYTSTGVLKLDVSQMKEMDLSIPSLDIPLDTISQSPTYAALAAIPFDEEIGLEREGKAEKSFTILKTISQRSEEEREKALAYLIGRGQGLTPSGDDMLVGFTMIRKAFIGVDGFEEALEKNVATHNTTDISIAYYKALFSGYVSSLFVSLIASMESEKQTEVSQLIGRIGKYGHTSGYDTLFGMYLGLQSLVNEMEE